jgi:hypothetical protein
MQRKCSNKRELFAVVIMMRSNTTTGLTSRS